jgi:Protein of unknown function (DUF2905)
MSRARHDAVADHPRGRADPNRAALAWLGKLGLGRLPGDIAIERENFRLYFPITTSILISLAVSLILWLLNR